MSRLGLRALFAALVIGAVTLGVATPLPTSSVWRDSVWTTAKVTTATSTTTTYLGGFTPGPDTTFPTAPVVTTNQRYGACIRLTVSSASKTPVKWSVRLDTKAQPWNGATDTRTDNWVYQISDLVDGRYRVITGVTGQTPARDTVMKGNVHEFTVCATPGPPPVGDSSWFNITLSKPVKVDALTVCKTVTAVALNQTPFWFRWRATVPTADMFAALNATTFSWYLPDWTVSVDPTPSTNPSSPSTVVLTSVTDVDTSLLRDEMRYDYTMCLKGT